MGRDNHPKLRQKARELQRRKATRQPYERLLIVCEGSKTEPQYLTEICRDLRLSTAHVHVQGSDFGTDPNSVVEFAEHLFRKGHYAKRIDPQAFDRIYCVFDRDEHQTYIQALDKVAALDKQLINDEKVRVTIQAVVSVPCFELWLLLHFESISAPLHRHDAFDRLRAHVNDYNKGQAGHWARTKALWREAKQRADRLSKQTDARNGDEPYTDMGQLVSALMNLRGGSAA